jgi:hypothetical protein
MNGQTGRNAETSHPAALIEVFLSKGNITKRRPSCSFRHLSLKASRHSRSASIV